jgi:uncharacterized protein (DUF362 family)
VTDERRHAEMMLELEAHLERISRQAKGDIRRELEGLYLLALEREALAVVGYGGEVVQARVQRLVVSEEVRRLVSYALKWAARDERSHAVLAQGLLAKVQAPVMRLKSLMADVGGLIAGWSSAVLQHTSWRRAPISRGIARAVTVVGRLAGKVPRTAVALLDTLRFREFCDFQVGAERTAAASWAKIAALMQQVPQRDRAHIAASIAGDEKKHEHMLTILHQAFDAEDRLTTGWSHERLREALCDVDASFVAASHRRDEVSVGSGGTVVVRESPGAARGEADALRALFREVVSPLLDQVVEGASKVAVKTTFMMGYDRRDPSPWVEPVLAEMLALEFRARGATDVVFLESSNHFSRFFAKRSVKELAAYAGFMSPHYRVEDAQADQVEYSFRRGYAEQKVSRVWRDADVRIVLGKVRSNPSWLAHLSLNTHEALGLPLEQLLFHDREADMSQALMMVLDALPAHLSILDATHHVPGGVTGILGDPKAVHPGRLYASRDPLALDLVVARHMGLTAFPRFGALAAALDWFDDPRPRTVVDGPDEPLHDYVSPHRNDWAVLLTALSYPVYLAGRDRGSAWVPKMDATAFPELPASLTTRVLRALLRYAFGFGRPR